MSTHVGYRCLSHETILDSEDWYNHGFERLNEVLQNRDVILEAFKHLDIMNVPPEVEWLQRHPHCHVVIGNEYGDIYNDKGEPIEKAKA